MDDGTVEGHQVGEREEEKSGIVEFESLDLYLLYM